MGTRIAICDAETVVIWEHNNYHGKMMRMRLSRLLIDTFVICLLIKQNR